MALDPAFGALLAQIANAPRPAGDSDPVAAARAGTAAMFTHPSAPEVVVREMTIAGPDGNEIALRSYRPHGTETDYLPILVFFHGGGFIAGGLDSHDGTARELTARAVCLVVSVDYRLAPEHRFPAALEDCVAALCWCAAHAVDIGGDASRIAIGGDSAGGNLCAGVALANRDRGGPHIAAQILVYPAIDPGCATQSMVDNGGGYMLTADSMRWMWSSYLGEADYVANPYAAPHNASTCSGLPPALVITAEYDPLRDEGEAYARQMAAHGVNVMLSRYGGQIHGFFSMYSLAPQAAAATDQVARTLRAVFATA